MAGRLVDSSDVKAGEILPVEYLSLVDSNKPLETSAAIQAVYLDRRQQGGHAATFHDTTIGGKSDAVSSDILNEVDKRMLKTIFNISEKELNEYSAEDLKREMIDYSLDNPTGMSKEYSRYLYNLEKRLGVTSKERLEVSDVTRRMSQRERGMKASQMAIEKHVYAAEPAEKLRKDILATSLFPNIYNRRNLMRAL